MSGRGYCCRRYYENWSTTVFNKGLVSKTLAFIYHKDMESMIALSAFHPLSCDKGNSGVWSVNHRGMVVGMLVGAVESMRVEQNELGAVKVFNQGCFIPVKEMLRWATRMLGEEVKIIAAEVSYVGNLIEVIALKHFIYPPT